MENKWDPEQVEDAEFLSKLELIKVKSIAIDGKKISLNWDELNHSDKPYNRSLNNGTAIPQEILNCQQRLYGFIRNYLCIQEPEGANCYIEITSIRFKEKHGDRLVKLSAILVVNNSRDIKLGLPEIPRYNFERDSEENEFRKAFPQVESEILDRLELEAKYYIEGKRGAEERTLFEEE